MIMLSLLFGLLAWGLAAAAIAVAGRRPRAYLVAGSFLASCISAVCPFLMILGHVNASHTAAVEDEITGIITGVLVMMGVALALNLAALIRLGR